jgi:hypothetical protein
MIKTIMAAFLIAAFSLVAGSVQARQHHHYHHKRIHHYNTTYVADYSDERIVSHPYGCPRTAFCGCGSSVEVFGHPVKSLYRAAAWFKFPRAAPAPGMAAVRNHHVMIIKALDGNGNAVVYDPNSGGHQTRIHIRSLAGYRIVNPHSSS